MSWLRIFAAAGTVGSLVLGGFTTWKASHGSRVEAAQVRFSGRDQALIAFIQSAKKNVDVRLDSLTHIPIANELGQAQQRGVHVSLELPVEAGSPSKDTRLIKFLLDVGASVAFRSDSTWNYCGAYVVVDGVRFFYTASPLDPCPKGAKVSYVVGPLPEAQS